MRLHEVVIKPGTFAGIKLHKQAEKAILQFIKKHKIPNATPVDDIHITLLYSKKHLPQYKPAGAINELAFPNKFTIFKSTPSDGSKSKNCLVLLLDSKFLHDRYSKLMKQHEATSDFDSYNPHITFSYDAGDLDISSPKTFCGDIELITEYKETLHNP